MSFTVEIEIAETEIGRPFFEMVDSFLRGVGLELEPGGKDGERRSAGVLVRGQPAHQSDEIFVWPDFDFVGAPEDLLSVPYLIVGRDNPGDRLVFSVVYSTRGHAKSLRIVGAGQCFRLWYEEYSRDLVLRAMAILDLLRSRLAVERAYCIDMDGSGELWIHLEGNSWEARPTLPLVASSEESLKILREFVDGKHSPLEFDENTESFFFRSQENGEVALTRHNLFDGSLLPISPVDREFNSVDEESEKNYLEICWRASRGVDDIVSELGSPDNFLGPIVVPENRVLAGQRAVKQQICYENLEDRFVVFFREYENGRVAVTLAGKRKAQ